MSRLGGVVRSAGAWLAKQVPLVGQLRRYDRSAARGDLVAGLTTGVLLVPQAMAYAMIAGLPPIVGLYASTLPLVAYALVGSSPHLSVGPVALVSLVVMSSVSELGSPGSAEMLSHVATLALMVGVMQLAMGVLRLGFIVDLLSHPVMTGFTAAAAILIALTQVGPLLGIDLQSTQQIHVVVQEVIANIGGIEVTATVMSAVCVTVLVLMRWRWPRVPRALIIVGLASVVTWWIGPQTGGLAVVGEVPSGLPGLSLPSIEPSDLGAMLPAALTVLMVAFMEAFAVAKITAREAGDEVEPERELAGLGVANAAACFVGSYPVGGAFSRTAVAARSGAKTNLASVVAAGVVIAVLLLLTPVFRFVPNAALASIIVVAVAGLFDWRELVRLFRIDRRDFGLAMLTFVITLVFGVKVGVATGVGASLVVFLARVARPKIHELGWLPGTEAFRARAHDTRTQSVDGVLTLRVQAPAFFANARYVRDRILHDLERTKDVHTVVVDASAIDHLDASAELEIQELLEDLEQREVVLRIACMTEEVHSTLERSGLIENLHGRLHSSLHQAVAAAADSSGSSEIVSKSEEDQDHEGRRSAQ